MQSDLHCNFIKMQACTAVISWAANELLGLDLGLYSVSHAVMACSVNKPHHLTCCSDSEDHTWIMTRFNEPLIALPDAWWLGTMRVCST